MRVAKIAITLDKKLLARLDLLVKIHLFPNRSKAIQSAVQEKISRLDHSRLARESAKLNTAVEQAMAEEGLSDELPQWPAY